MANGFKIQGGPIKADVSVITFVVPFTNPESISLAFGQSGAASGTIPRFAVSAKPTSTSVAMQTHNTNASFTPYAPWIAVGF